MLTRNLGIIIIQNEGPGLVLSTMVEGMLQVATRKIVIELGGSDSGTDDGTNITG